MTALDTLKRHPIIYTGLKDLFTFILAAFILAYIWFGLATTPMEMRIALIVFSLATLGWMLTEINDTYIALVAAAVLTVLNINTPDELFATLGDSTIWLLIASFIVAAGFTQSGLSHRLINFIAFRARSVKGLFFSLTGLLMATAFLIPATSGRAALTLPLFTDISRKINNPRVSRALALLFPVIILLSAGASLIGAGAHLVTVEILRNTGNTGISFAQWLLWGLPFSLVSSLMAILAILFIFLDKKERNMKIDVATFSAKVQTKLSRQEVFTVVVLALLITLWLSEPLHRIDNTLVAIFGALLLTLPGIGVITFKDAFKNVEWNIILFMAATLKIGEALVDSGAADWLVQNLFNKFFVSGTASPFWIIVAIATISLLAHLFINSRTARSSVLIPIVILISISLNYDPTALGFISTIAAGYCITLPVSAKPVAMFSQVKDVESYKPQDLLKLSGVLLPAHMVLILIFSFTIWPALGLDLQPSVSFGNNQAIVWNSNSLLETFTSELSGFDNSVKEQVGGRYISGSLFGINRPLSEADSGVPLQSIADNFGNIDFRSGFEKKSQQAVGRSASISQNP